MPLYEWLLRPHRPPVQSLSRRLYLFGLSEQPPAKRDVSNPVKNTDRWSTYKADISGAYDEWHTGYKHYVSPCNADDRKKRNVFPPIATRPSFQMNTVPIIAPITKVDMHSMILLGFVISQQQARNFVDSLR